MVIGAATIAVISLLLVEHSKPKPPFIETTSTAMVGKEVKTAPASVPICCSNPCNLPAQPISSPESSILTVENR
jgi:hypothetical protein